LFFGSKSVRILLRKKPDLWVYFTLEIVKVDTTEGGRVSTAKPKTANVAAAATVDGLRIAAIVLCIIGLFVAGYLSWAELAAEETVCADTGKIDCAAVQKSAYADTYGLPVGVTGFLGYVAILGVLILEDQVKFLATYGRTIVVCMALFGVIFLIYLSLIEATVLDAWCQWCVASAIIITLLLVVSILRLTRFLAPLRS